MFVFVYTEFAAQFDHFATHFIIRHPFILVCKSKNVKTGQISISTTIYTYSNKEKYSRGIRQWTRIDFVIYL